MTKLYITPGSPYARMARIVVLEKGLENRVEIIPARTRLADSPYYGINASGRVPYLACALGLEARNPDFRWRPRHPKLCAWFDRVAARPSFTATAPPNR